jgi:formylglycine-generating enzyme required for sulfatase activity
MTSPPISSSAWWTLGLLVLACEATPADEFAWLDEAPRVPEGRAIPEVERSTPDAQPDGSDCGKRTGRTQDGTCRLLATDDANYVERVLLPAGRFVIGRVPLVYDGSTAKKIRSPRWPNQPPRFADVESFWIDLVEVTREAYAECVSEGACSPATCVDGSDGRRDPTSEITGLPQTCVTHSQAKKFCAHRGGRLPTATEWEYAARGVDARVFPWGNEIRDEITDVIMPVSIRVDASYFGILGLGSNANEWVADAFEHDLGLASFASGFRDADGPMAQARREWELRLACGESRDKCALSETDTQRFAIKGPAVVGVRAARDSAPRGETPPTTLEGWKEVVQHPQLGFRCAADVRPSDPEYVVPALPPQIPWIVRTSGEGQPALEIFGGIAEAVSRAEARRFCAVLHLPREEPGGWRLPTLDEIIASANFFRGPGPFWSEDGSVEQVGGTWSARPLADEDALLARCVRDAQG